MASSVHDLLKEHLGFERHVLGGAAVRALARLVTVEIQAELDGGKNGLVAVQTVGQVHK